MKISINDNAAISNDNDYSEYTGDKNTFSNANISIPKL